MLLVFSHANSFPASTYKVLFNGLRSRGFTVKAIDKYGHDPKYPASNNWPHLLQHLADFAGRAEHRIHESLGAADIRMRTSRRRCKQCSGAH